MIATEKVRSILNPNNIQIEVGNRKFAATAESESIRNSH